MNTVLALYDHRYLSTKNSEMQRENNLMLWNGMSVLPIVYRGLIDTFFYLKCKFKATTFMEKFPQ